MAFPDAVQTERTLREIALVRAWLPWLPWCGVRQSGTASTYFHQHDVEERSHYVLIPTDSAALDDAALRRVIRHEMGHLWAYWLGQRQQGFDVIAALGIDPTHPQRGEIAAEVFSRWLGEPASYPALEPLSRVTAARATFIENSGNLPSLLAERVALDNDIRLFWKALNDRGHGAPLYVSDLIQWAERLQRDLELRIFRFVGLID